MFPGRPQGKKLLLERGGEIHRGLSSSGDIQFRLRGKVPRGTRLGLDNGGLDTWEKKKKNESIKVTRGMERGAPAVSNRSESTKKSFKFAEEREMRV